MEKTLRGKNEDLTLIWNILNGRKTHLIQEIEYIESVLVMIEDRNEMFRSNKF